MAGQRARVGAGRALRSDRRGVAVAADDVVAVRVAAEVARVDARQIDVAIPAGRHRGIARSAGVNGKLVTDVVRIPETGARVVGRRRHVHVGLSILQARRIGIERVEGRGNAVVAGAEVFVPAVDDRPGPETLAGITGAYLRGCGGADALVADADQPREVGRQRAVAPLRNTVVLIAIDVHAHARVLAAVGAGRERHVGGGADTRRLAPYQIPLRIQQGGLLRHARIRKVVGIVEGESNRSGQCAGIGRVLRLPARHPLDARIDGERRDRQKRNHHERHVREHGAGLGSDPRSSAMRGLGRHRFLSAQ